MNHPEVDREKATVEDHAPSSSVNNGEVDREKATVEDAPSSSVHNGEVDREKATVEDAPSSSVHNGEVDREKATVEDAPSSSVNNGEVDREKATVEDPPSSSVHNGEVDREKATVEDDAPSSSVNNGEVDREKATVEDPPSSSVNNGEVDREKATVEDVPSSSVHNAEVDREKATVEDVPSSSANNAEVDREKATVEDPSSSANNAHGLAQRLGDECNIVEGAGHDELFSQHKWIIRLHIQGTPDRALIKGIPTASQCYEWNTPVTFGRGRTANIFLSDEKASRLHFDITGQILPNGDAYFTIRNLSSTKGFSFNGCDIIANDQRINIKTGDAIGVSGLSFKVEIVPGQNMQNFVLEFIQPQESNPNMGVVGWPPPNNMVFMQPHVGPLSPGFQGPVFVPAAVLPAGAVPVNANIPWSATGVGPAQPFGNMFYPPGYGGADRVQVFNFSNPPIPVNPAPHRPVQEVEAPEQKQTGRKTVTKQPSENNEDSLSETTGKPLQDTQRPKDID